MSRGKRFKQALVINRDALDEDWVDQPTLTQEAAEKLAEAVLALDRAELALDVKEGELDSL